MTAKTGSTWLPAKKKLRQYREDWRLTYALSNHLFDSYGIGYWASLVGSSAKPLLGLLIYDDEAAGCRFTEPQREMAVASWLTLSSLPKHFYTLDGTLANRAFDLGVRKWGERFMDDMDLPRADQLIQVALFGEVKYR